MRTKEEVEPAKPLTEEEKQAAAKAEYDRLLNMRSGGVYIPPARLRALQAQITDKTSKEYQRMAWEALKKSINGLINKVNVSNIKHIVPELFNENLVRGRGLFCRSIMKAQAASLPFTPIYAAMAAIVNTKLPQVGELLVNTGLQNLMIPAALSRRHQATRKMRLTRLNLTVSGKAHVGIMKFLHVIRLRGQCTRPII